MTEAAGLVLSAFTLWRTAIAVYDLLDTSRQFGLEYEILSVKYEVERVRLVCWGNALGLPNLADIKDGEAMPLKDLLTATQESGTSNTLTRLNNDLRHYNQDVWRAVIRVLRCIQHIFEDTNRLQERYGLQATTSHPADTLARTASEDGGSSSPKRSPLAGVFRRVDDTLRKVAKDRHKSTPLRLKTRWVIRDRKLFINMIADLRAFNDSLDSLIPEARARAIEAMKRDINHSAEAHGLALLEEATADEIEPVSEAASMRLVELGVTKSDRTELLTVLSSEDDDSDSGSEGTVKYEKDEVDEEASRLMQVRLGRDSPKLQPPTPQHLASLEAFMRKQNMGALITRLIYRENRVSAHVRWSGEEIPMSRDREKGSAGALHSAFRLYKKDKYLPRPTSSGNAVLSDPEDHLLLDPECHICLESDHPGTVTVEGFGLECWAYLERILERLWKRSNKTDNAELSLISKARLLRRLDEIQKSPGSLGRSLAVERMHLKELLHIPDTRSDQRRSSDLESVLDYICTSLDGNSSFIDFLNTPSIAKQIRSADTQTEISILRQIVLGWELAARIQNLNRPLPHLSRFTERVLANLIISSLWLKHVRLVLVDQKASVTKALKVAKTTEHLEAEQYSQRGADALRENRFQEAADMYARSINIHQRDADSWRYYSEALMEMGKYEDAENAAYIAAQLQPTWQAMSLLADIMLRQGHGQRAKRACEKAIQLAGDDAHRFCLYDQLAVAERKINEAADAIQRETDEDKAHQLLSNFLDEDWDTLGKKVEFTSLVTEQQEQGLLRFAESIRWPYINEVRNQVKQAQTGAFDGGLGSHLSDWLCGLTLPGKWCAAKIMTALITWTPTVRKKVGGAYYEQCGLSLSTCSYWRVRSIMGRVLGCLPGTVSLCGWIGPCPPVKFRSSRSTSETIRRIQILALPLPTPSKPIGFDDDIHAQEIDVSSLLNNLPVSENTPAYVADMMNWSKWVTPDTPVHDHSTYSIKCISLFKAPRKVCYNKKARVAEGPETHQMAAATSSGYRWESHKLKYIAIISFTKDGSEEINCFLFSNPIFVDLPPCRPNTSNGHEVHVRDLNDYQNIWSIDELMKGTRDDFNGNKRVMVINATGNGAETVARAWCAEHGRHAVIRRAGGPCLVCSVRAASKEGLDTGVVIWTD